jgi:hypothetical protein
LIDFLDELGLFIKEKPICTKKKFPSLCRLPSPSPRRLPKKFGSPLLPFPSNLETSALGLVTDLVPNRSYWFLDFGNKFRRVAPIRIFGSFFTFSWNNDQFYCFWAWFNVKFYAELKKVYFMPLWGLKCNRESWRRETWNSYKSCKKNLIFSVKKFTFSMELEVFFTFIQQTYSKLVISFMNRKSSCGYATHFFYFISRFSLNLWKNLES